MQQDSVSQDQAQKKIEVGTVKRTKVETSMGRIKINPTDGFSSKYLRSPVTGYKQKTDYSSPNYDFTKKLETKAANREESQVRGHRATSQNQNQNARLQANMGQRPRGYIGQKTFLGRVEILEQ